MKRIILYAGILAALFAAPVKENQVGRLIPVQVVSIYKEEDHVVIKTDTEDKGIGITAQEALQNMEDTANGIIYLDTAEYLLFSTDARGELEELRKHLDPSVRVCTLEKPLDMENIARFLDSHDGLPKLKDWKTDAGLPVLSTFEDSYIFLKKVENNA